MRHPISVPKKTPLVAIPRDGGVETAKKYMPKQKPGRSVQDVATPPDLIAAVEARWGKLTIDLAATAENAKAPSFIPPEEDSLSVDWRAKIRKWSLYLSTQPKAHPGAIANAWLNPPFGDITPWASQCAATECLGSWDGGLATTPGLIFFLTPASVGANWFQEFVHNRALVFFLAPRLTFVGHSQPYPKDCILSVFGLPPGYEPWRWDGGEARKRSSTREATSEADEIAAQSLRGYEL